MEAKKLDNTVSPKDSAQESSAILLDSMEQLCACVLSDASFKAYKIEINEEHVCTVQKEDLALIILGYSVWSNPVKMDVFKRFIGKLGIGVMCVGHELNLASMPEDLKHKEIFVADFPISTTHLKLQIDGAFKAISLIKELRTEKEIVHEANEHVKYVLSISRELNGIRDTKKLLNLILTRAREVTGADAGSIYTVDSPTDNLKDGTIFFKITQNESVKQNLDEFKIPVSDSSIVGKAVLSGKSINIKDLYDLSDDPEKNPWQAKHDKSWDKRIGYECHSMLTVPMFDISHKVIGVIQLINRKKDKKKVLTNAEDFKQNIGAFTAHDVEYAEIVAQQAGIALENALLTEEKEELFDGFVDASVKAIEQRDPTTSGHSHRVATLTVEMAKIIDRVDVGIFKNIKFNEYQIKEIQYASLLHDFGKLGVREQVLVKAKKLYPWQMDLMLERFELIKSRHEIDFLKKQIKFLNEPQNFPPGLDVSHFEKEFQSKLDELNEHLQFILKANEPTILEQGGFEKLKDIANCYFSDTKNPKRPYLLTDELKALSVSKGSLTAEEFAEIQSHVTHTYEFLRHIPWGKNLANVPQIAAKHHEKMDGSGYPTQAGAEEIPVQSRIMTISDIFDALTAADRPYKKAVPVDKALAIIEMEVKSGKCDPELFKIFIESNCYKLVLGS